MDLSGVGVLQLVDAEIEADVARLHFVNDIIETGKEVFGESFLEKLNFGMDPQGRRPLKRIDNLVVRPSSDLGRIAADVVREDTELDFGAFLGMLRKFGGAGENASESDLLSYLLFDATYARRLIEIGYKDAEASEEELAEFFSHEG